MASACTAAASMRCCRSCCARCRSCMCAHNPFAPSPQYQHWLTHRHIHGGASVGVLQPQLLAVPLLVPLLRRGKGSRFSSGASVGCSKPAQRRTALDPSSRQQAPPPSFTQTGWVAAVDEYLIHLHPTPAGWRTLRLLLLGASKKATRSFFFTHDSGLRPRPANCREGVRWCRQG